MSYLNFFLPLSNSFNSSSVSGMVVPGLLNLETLDCQMAWDGEPVQSVLLLCLPTVTDFFIINMQILSFFKWGFREKN